MPTTTVSIAQAKADLARLLRHVSAGGNVVVTRYGRPVAQLVPMDPPAPGRRPGCLKGKFQIATDFDRHLPRRVLHAFTDGAIS